MPTYSVQPNAIDRPKAVRGVYIYNLVDCLHICILKRDLARARRAWAILIRCPDVNWRERWSWGLYLLTATERTDDPERGRNERGGSQDGDRGREDSAAPAPNPYAQPIQPRYAYSQREEGQDAFLFLRDIRLSAKEADKPGVLAEQVLHLIAVGRYRDALDELNTYLLDYPYTLSASLHTYAGMVCFYLAQPPSMRREPKPKPPKINQASQETKPVRGRHSQRESTADTDRTGTTDLADSERRAREGSVDSSGSDSTVDALPPPPDANLMRQARNWFMSAIKLDPNEAVAQGFIHLIDKPLQASDDEMDLDESFDQSREEKPFDSDHEMASVSPIAPTSRLPMQDAGEYFSGSDEGEDGGREEDD